MKKVSDFADKLVETDVLVVGSGGAGCEAAVAARRLGVRTTLVTKGGLGNSGCTLLAGGGIEMDGKSAYDYGFGGDKNHNPDVWFKEMLIEGFYLNNQRIVERFVEEAGIRLKELIDLGMSWTCRGDAGSGTTSIKHFRGGKEMGRVFKLAVEKQDIDVYEDVMLADALTEDGRIVGAIGIDIHTGDIIVFKCKAIVLATGGWGRIYSLSSMNGDLTGDGQAIAYRAGAEIANMEMVTFAPCVIIWPPIHRGMSTFTYSWPRYGGEFINSRGELIFKKYDPNIEKISRTTEWDKNIWSIICMREIVAGKGSPHGGIWSSLKHLPWNMIEETLGERRKKVGWKFGGEPMATLMEWVKEGNAVETCPAAHYMEGGVSINERCETSLPGLFAGGECSTGCFGANRVSDATTEMIVLGYIAGNSAAEYAKKAKDPKINLVQLEKLHDKILQPLKRKKGIRPVDLRKKIQKIADDSINVIRNGPSINQGIIECERMKKEDLQRLYTTTDERKYNLEWIEALQLENMIICLEASARSAIMRTESRGAHYREDHLYMDNDTWLKEIVIKKAGDDMALTTKTLTTTTGVLPTGKIKWEDYIIWAVDALSDVYSAE